MKRVALGLSGGVDSAVSALLLKQQGHDVHCIYLNCFDDDVPGCRTREDRKDALAVALHLKLPFQVLDFRKEYQASVIDYFRREYEVGRTPNPDVVCNRDIKFGLFYQWAIAHQHFDFIATGHYAKLVYRDPNDPNEHPNSPNEDYSEHWDGFARLQRLMRSICGQGYSDRIQLLRLKDEHKDQTYFLWQVPRERFERVLFPLGDYLKSEVRKIARKAKLPVADKPDSTGICFIGEVRVEDFLKRLGVKEKEGEVVIKRSTRGITSTKSTRGRNPERLLASGTSGTSGTSDTSDYEVIGRHKGVWFYTIGQRHGFEVTRWPPRSSRHPERSRDLRGGVEGSSGSGQNIRIASLDSSSKTPRNDGNGDRPPFYVIEKDVKRNRLIVGFGAETYREKFVVGDCHWLVEDKFFSQTQISNLKSQNLAQSSKLEDIFVRIRHGGELIPCELSVAGRQLEVALATPARGIAAGQSAVFYLKDGIVLGGGVIQ